MGYSIYHCYYGNTTVHFREHSVQRASTLGSAQQVQTTLVGLLLMATQIQGLALAPMVNMEDMNAQVSITLPTTNATLNIFKTEGEAGLLYKTSLDYNRILIRVDRVVDLSEFALASANFVTLLRQVNMSYFDTQDEFTSENQDFIISITPLTYTECQLFCSKNDMHLVKTVDDFLSVRNKTTDRIWVKTSTFFSPPQEYHVFLHNNMIFPDNSLNYSIKPTIWYQKSGNLKQVESINVFYTSYFDSNSREYWPTAG